MIKNLRIGNRLSADIPPIPEGCGARIARLGVLGNGKRAPRALRAVENGQLNALRRCTLVILRSSRRTSAVVPVASSDPVPTCWRGWCPQPCYERQDFLEDLRDTATSAIWKVT